MPRACSVPGCRGDATGLFCPTHYFALPAKQARWIARLQIMIARADDDETKRHLGEQLHGYVCQAVRAIQNTEATSSQAASAGARRLPSSAAGALGGRHG